MYVCGPRAVYGATLPPLWCLPGATPYVCARARRHRDGGSPTAGAAAYNPLLARALERIAVPASTSLLVYPYALRAAASSSTGLGFALGRIGGTTRGGGGAAAPGLVVHAAGVARGRSVSSTPAGNAPVPGDQGVGMEQPKQQQQPQVPPQDAAGGKNKRDDMHKTTGDVMTHSFGEGYSTRSDEEGFGGVYGGNDPVEHPGTEIHPGHPDYDTSLGSELKEKEKARHLKDEKHATA